MKIFTIVVTFNGENWIRKCLDTLLDSSLSNYIIVVDNASKDNSIDIIEKEFPTIILLKQTKNLGFGKANNIGITYALNKGAEHIFLLNQDAYIRKDTISKLVEVSVKNRNYAILSPVHLNWEGDLIEYYFERFIAKNRKFYSDCILKKTMDEVYEVPFVNAAAWLIPRKTFEEIGGFDPIFYHYGEDNNYCQRVKYHGLKIGVVPESYILHASKIRVDPNNFIFSEAYYNSEIKKLLIKNADINLKFTKKDFGKIKFHIIKLMVINLINFKFKYVLGYFRKYKRFHNYYDKIELSRKQNIEKNAHYL